MRLGRLTELCNRPPPALAPAPDGRVGLSMAGHLRLNSLRKKGESDDSGRGSCRSPADFVQCLQCAESGCSHLTYLPPLWTDARRPRRAVTAIEPEAQTREADQLIG